MLRAKIALTKLLEILVTLCVASLVLVVLWGVFTRFMFNCFAWFPTLETFAMSAGETIGVKSTDLLNSTWTVEVATNLLAWVALLGAAVGFSQKQHLGVDLIYTKLHPSGQRTMAIITQLLVITFAACIMLWGGSNLVLSTLATGQVTSTLEIPKGYVYLSVPVSGFFIILFSIEQIVEILVRVPQEEDEEATDAEATVPQCSD